MHCLHRGSHSEGVAGYSSLTTRSVLLVINDEGLQLCGLLVVSSILLYYTHRSPQAKGTHSDISNSKTIRLQISFSQGHFLDGMGYGFEIVANKIIISVFITK
ncbi:hypothetical protein CY34DRAFT_563938 [Suillus luteus UH-Slu-Lm8-n1]|uniref:Uncharacterized protein n=1 Tax=Suillus luteus UH-Slu-Lm8-n1 TaxID=930992 RepID=A0A0D0A4S7_9AGAM|nr:hypothetical protein CY34DRAFT_563938 [Suillus luteus UH-Slu-Lm8-n1]